jgi:WhiB family redox-sensing transcriptional regulator
MTTAIRSLITSAASAPDASPRATDWREEAVCRDEDPELFFPIGHTGPARLQAEKAKAVCRRCPVMLECLAWATGQGLDSGVWGGVDLDEGAHREVLDRKYASHAAQGRHIATHQGAELLVLLRRDGLSEEEAAQCLDATVEAVAAALRLLAPKATPGRSLTIVEQLVMQADTIETLIRGGRTQKEIAEFFGTTATSMSQARMILAQRDAAAELLDAAVAA